MDAREALLKAAEIIGRDGHYKGSLCDGDPETGPVCAMGALFRALTGKAQTGIWTEEQSLILREASSLLYTAVPTERSIPGWNDDTATSAEDVILAFKRAAH